MIWPLGGCEIPGYPLSKVPGHESTGPQINNIITLFLAERPHVMEDILDAVGKPKGEVKGPRSEDIVECRNRVARFLHADLDHDPGLTEVCAPLIRAWIEAANDPDTPLADWLFRGAPAGVDEHPECVGIFPLANEPPSREFKPTYYTEGCVNYVSMDDSPHGEEVLGKLISAGYVIRYSSIDEAMQAHSGKEILVSSKLALITTEKEGQLKHRLILDCRVSGANASTTK